MIKNILKGIKAYTGTFALISKLKLWKYFLAPIIISIITATIVGFTAYGLSDNIGRFITKIWSWKTGIETFTSILSYLGGAIIIVLGFILYKHIVMALSAVNSFSKVFYQTTSLFKTTFTLGKLSLCAMI